MNCQKFESVVSELARGQMMAAEQRAEALAHGEECADCTIRLHNEKTLTRGLQSLAAEMESLSAPAGAERELLNAFRAHHQVVVPMAKKRIAPRYWWAAAVAAMILIAISVAAFRSSSVRFDEPQQARKPQQQPQPKPGVANESQQPKLEPVDEEQGPKVDQVVRDLKPRRPRPANTRRPANAQVANHVVNEVATDFIPLSYMNAANLQDGGQIVRVQLPRSALANFGLPVNMDRYNEKVKADVLLGADGMAHAIRFVQ